LRGKLEMDNTILLKNVSIIDGTGTDSLVDGSVVVEGKYIKDIYSGGNKFIPSNAIVVDCRGQTLLPGLIDAHVHMGPNDAYIGTQHRLYSPSMFVIKTLHVIKETLDQGFTTVRDCGGIDAGYREAIEQGLFPGPRLLVAGYAISQTGGHGDVRLPTEVFPPREYPTGWAIVCDGVDEVRRGVREQLRLGVDHVKVMAGGGCASPTGELESSQYTVEELKAAVYEAESAGKYVCAHLYSPRSIINCVEAGIRSFEHGNLLDANSAEAIKRSGGFLVPTLATHEITYRMRDRLAFPEYVIRKHKQARETILEAVNIAHRSGVKIASGSDLIGPKHPYKALEIELKARIVGPMNAIVSATKTNAELLRRGHDIGTIECGKLADLILVDGDPLKNIGILQEYREKITIIMKEGTIYKNIL
jgi:imidazolonepropionase-like amidohydrolase